MNLCLWKPYGKNKTNFNSSLILYTTRNFCLKSYLRGQALFWGGIIWMYLTFMKSYITIILIWNEEYRAKLELFSICGLWRAGSLSLRFRGYILDAGFCQGLIGSEKNIIWQHEDAVRKWAMVDGLWEQSPLVSSLDIFFSYIVIPIRKFHKTSQSCVPFILGNRDKSLPVLWGKRIQEQR